MSLTSIVELLTKKLKLIIQNKFIILNLSRQFCMILDLKQHRENTSKLEIVIIGLNCKRKKKKQ